MAKGHKKFRRTTSRSSFRSGAPASASTLNSATSKGKSENPSSAGGSREVTPPTIPEGSFPASAFVTPELVHSATEEPSPDDPLIKTPNSSIHERVADIVPLSPELVQDGITGSDKSLKLFDGTSENNADYFIAIEDASMETAPDVRPYFWLLGQWQKGHTELDIPSDHQKRVVYDNELVRAGRQVLQLARREGRGYYLNEKRYLLDHNKPGDTWYRMPAVAVIKATFDGGEGLPAQEDEGTFYDGGGELGDEFAGNRIVLTNIRAPCLFGKYAKFPPGTKFWDAGISGLYSFRFFVHLGYAAFYNPWEIADDQRLDKYTSTDYQAVEAMMTELWPYPPPSPSTLPWDGTGPQNGETGGWWSWLL